MFSTNEANHANYATAGIALVVLLTRIITGRYRQTPLDLSFLLVILSILFVTIRITLNYFQLRLGTTNSAVLKPDYLATHSPSNVSEGSKAVLGARIALTCILWLQVCLLLLFYKAILHSTRWVRHMITLTWIVAAITFIIVVLVTLFECRPLHKFWQVYPKPDMCARAFAELLAQCICNIILDIMLLIISFPILFHRGRDWSTNIRIWALFILGTFCMAVTTMRIQGIFGMEGIQTSRTVWGAVQIIVATFVANAPIIYGDLRVIVRRKREVQVRRMTRSESWVGLRSGTTTGNTSGMNTTDDDDGVDDLDFGIIGGIGEGGAHHHRHLTLDPLALGADMDGKPRRRSSVRSDTFKDKNDLESLTEVRSVTPTPISETGDVDLEGRYTRGRL